MWLKYLVQEKETRVSVWEVLVWNEHPRYLFSESAWSLMIMVYQVLLIII